MRDERIKQLASAICVVAGDDPYNFKLKAYEAACDALRTLAGEVYEGAATKLDHYAAGLEALGGKGSTAMAAAKMVRGLKEYR